MGDLRCSETPQPRRFAPPGCLVLSWANLACEHKTIRPRRSGLSALALSPQERLGQLDPSTFDVVSTDLFDTVLMRDLSLEDRRFDEAAHDAAGRLGLHPERLSALRRSFHRIAYNAVAAERPLADASLETICRAIATAMGRGEAAAVLREAEVEMDIRHLSPNRPLIAAYAALAAKGKRVIATTDTYYSADEIRHMLGRVIGDHPISQVYASCDIGLTKHAGAIFAEVARREGVCPTRILHLGDNFDADVRQARAAGWQAVHLPRGIVWRRLGKLAVRLSTAQSRKGQ